MVVCGLVRAATDDCIADSTASTALTYTCGTIITANSPVNGGVRYGRIIRLQYNGSYNGNLIATFEAYPDYLGICQSVDDGFTWEQTVVPYLSSVSGWTMRAEPDLFELPQAVGNLSAGTIFLAGNSETNGANGNRMEVWYSTNQGQTWQFRGLVDQSTNQGNTDEGLWEPRLALSSSGQLVCYYSDDRFQSEGYNQLIGERVSPDGGLTWGPEIYVCAIPDGVRRPGMAVTARMPNGQYVMSYEGVGFGANSQVYIKFSNDGTNWGSATNPGTAIQTASGAYVGATPYIMWSPFGGPNGTLVVSGQNIINTPNTDREFLINTNFGQGNWTMIPAAVQWQGGGDSLNGWSQGMVPTADGQGIIQMSSSVSSANTNYNEMLVGREQLILPSQTYNFANQNSGLALEVPGNSPIYGVKLQQNFVSGGPAQQWTFNDLGNNVWTLTNWENQMAWDDTGWGTNAGTPLEQYTYNGLAVQQFKLRPIGNGNWNFINVNSDLFVSVTNASKNPGAALVLWTNSATSEQNWFVSQPAVIPVAYYGLNGSALDNSGHGNDGTPGSSATNYVVGRNGTLALQFNGTNSYVQIPRSIGSGSSFAITFWMETTSTGGAGPLWNNGAGLVDGTVFGATDDFGVSLLGGQIAFGVGNPNTTLQSTVAVNDGKWHQVVVTRNGFTGMMTIYLDGTLNTNLIGPVGTRMAPPYLRLGSLATGAAGFYNGELAEVRLYNGWLDTNAITQLFTAPAPLLELKFDESSGTTAADATGNSWNGTLVNGPTWIPGESGNAVSLSGVNQYVSLPPGVVRSLNDFTISAWVNLSTRSAGAHLFDFGNGTNSYMFLSPAASAGGMLFAITTAGSNSEQSIYCTNNIPLGAWHNVAVTFAAGVGILYLDGLPVATNIDINLTPSLLGNTVQNWIGRSQYSSDPYLNGVVDDFRIYNDAMSIKEIASLVTPLVAPSRFNGTGSDSQAILNWAASVDANGYNLKCSLTNGGPYNLVASGLTTLGFTNIGLLNGTNYFYVVTATNSVGESSNSIQISVRPTSALPPTLSFSMSAGQMQLAWPSDHTGWMLQVQTNPPDIGLGTNWVSLPESTFGSQYQAPMYPAMQSVFYRLQSP